MKLCDVTLAYTATSGGIRTYIDNKRAYLAEHTDHEHLLIVPGEEDALEHDGPLTKQTIASPILPGCEPYRFFWRPDKIQHALKEAAPEVVELGSFYVAPWPAFSYRRDRRKEGFACLVSGYFHSDIADAYFGAPLRDAFDGWSDVLEWFGDRLAGAAESGAESFVGSVFEKCDVRLAASPAQAKRLAEYGVEHPVEILPLGVDIDLFTPDRRSDEFRERLGVDRDTVMMVYAGRLDAEKHPHVLIDAFERLPKGFKACLVMLGEGPLKDELRARADKLEGVFVLPYESAATRFAELLASADVYVTAGPHETFGLSVVEAQASGLPVVGVASGALNERVSPADGRLGPVNDAQAMADNIVAVARDRSALGAAGREKTVRELSWDRSFEKLLAIYERELAKPTARKP
ncbi:glycosyltransferase [Botrimarina sp.]|uniref:glycosyltransferase n=1 Tax=Botrimarina sp. TaxID=2795802 RepID=UPI0032EBE80D